ncbi:general secretion pathway protein G [Alcanivorax nanhaiticus]|uniref:Type II secretion system protein H n=1 Tax=Alcanivorax nanhaiticus TaxID=1177154 RepID=A0A095SH76_9GAMM|nr:GspH/FimT family pseudopilin [Alcanivorax nanhaiticus]KGD63694.1 general secretion pathway protein G [Alcanivorax nanhaiticus]
MVDTGLLKLIQLERGVDVRTSGKRTFQAGFTLVEAMVVLMIFGVVAAIAMPSMERSVTQSQVKKAARDLAMTINTARAYAVSRRESIVIEADGGDSGNEWGNSGWVLRLPAGVDGDQAFETPNKILVDETKADVDSFSIGADGRIYNAAGTAVIAQLNFEICPTVTTGVVGRKLEVNVFGKVRISDKRDC